MMRYVSLIVAVAAFAVSPSFAVAQDASAGEQVFRKCRACHQVGPTARNGVGPAQNGVVGRTAGTVPGYNYSALNKAAGAAGLVWTEDNIFNYLAEPNAFLKAYVKSKGTEVAGNTKMVFKLADPTERRNVIAYLKQFAGQ